MVTTDFMSLVLPVSEVTTGPGWAVLLNTALTTVDSHDHTTGKGNAITQAALSFNATVDFNEQTASNISAVTFQNLTSTIATAVSVFSLDGDLYYNDNASNSVRITSGGALDVSSVGGIGGDYTTTSATSFYTDATLTYYFQDSNADRASLDANLVGNFTTYSSAQSLNPQTDQIVLVSGNTTLTLPAAATSSGVRFDVKKTDSNATTVTIDGNGSETIDGETTQTITEQYTSVHLVCNGTTWYIL